MSQEPVKPERHPVPWDDHDRVVKGFHKRLDALDWATKLDRQRVEDALLLADLYERSPQQIVQHLAARLPSEPDLRLQADDGTPLGEVLKPFIHHHVQTALEAQRREFEERFGPIESQFQQAKQVETLANQVQAATAWPGFTDHVDAITDAITEANRDGRRLSLHDAYIQVVVPKLLASQDSLRAEEKKKLLAELTTTSANAKRDLNPGRTPASAPLDPQKASWQELLHAAATQSGGAGA